MSKNNKYHPALEILFGSRLRVKILKFLFRSNFVSFGTGKLAKHVQEPFEAVKKEVEGLEKIGLIKKS